MTYEQAIERLAALGPEVRTGRTADQTATAFVPRKFALEHMRALLTALGEPQQRFPSVLIAGTNGKGSTAATLASIAHAAGLRVGLYTSPHLQHITERIRISSPAQPAQPSVLAELDPATFGEHFGRVDAAARELVERGQLPHLPSYFEILTAVGFCAFAAAAVDLAVLEVGLGGRLDATNTVEPLVSVITDIGIDHTEYLGHTLREIATEKAGILRQDGVLVTLSQHPEANAAIGETAMRLNVRGVDAARCLPGAFGPNVIAANFNSVTPPHEPVTPHHELVTPRDELVTPHDESVTPPHESVILSGAKDLLFASPTPTASPISTTTLLPRNRYDLAIDGEPLTVDSPLAGQHQQRNLALALATAIELRTNHGFTIPNTAIEAGVRATVWPGRLEWIPGHHGHAPVLLDVAHNPAGAWTLRAALAQLPDAMPRTLIFSALADKQIDEMAQVLLPLFDSTSGDPDRAHDHVILAPIQSPRAATLEQLLAVAHKLDVPAHAAPHLPAALAQAQAITPPGAIIVATGSIFLVGELRALLTPPGTVA
jgi:dihydrofolate synthase/folylpolyglutamate synthase